jgi:hypothetical protein
MSRFFSLRGMTVTALALLAFATLQPFAAADPLITITGIGNLTDVDGVAVLRLTGNASHLGKFACYGEIDFEPGDEEGSVDGAGVVAFRAANGDMLVGVITWQIDANGMGQARFRWLDAVTFADGTTAESTGRFAERRPQGAVVMTLSHQDIHFGY